MNIEHCTLCPNKCGINRKTHIGYCGMPSYPIIARAELHNWEEPIIGGNNGAGAIFFSGCSMSCVFCQNYEISALRDGHKYSLDQLIKAIKGLEAKGAECIDFVNPTHYAHVIREVLMQYKPSIPVVYNTGGYDSVDTLMALEGLIDVYLPDFKYIDSCTAAKYSAKSDYPYIAMEAIKEMYRQTGKAVIVDGLLKRGVLIRHLLLPDRVVEAKKIFDYLYGEYGENVWYSAMSQYIPYGKASKYPELNRKIKPIEYKALVAHINKLGINNCFVQELASADEKFIPPFATTSIS